MARISAQPKKPQDAPKPGSALRKISPTCRMPTDAVLNKLSPEDRELLESILGGLQECVYHPDFRRSTMPGENFEVPPGTQQTSTFYDESVVGDPPPPSSPTEVLTADEERTLFLRFNYCRNRVIRILRAHRGKRLTANATRDLLVWHKRALETRTQIVRANTSLVLAMARRSRNSGVEISELISEGNLALLRCVDKFDASRGFKFSTYACRAILASFSRAGAKAARYRTQFPAAYDPALERSDYLEIQREQIEHECVDTLKNILFENTAELSSVERRVLDARFSLGKDQAPTTRRKTLDQVGVSLGVSKERVRQIQNQAMDKLRAVLEERLLAAS